jgi:hypothetical protein
MRDFDTALMGQLEQERKFRPGGSFITRDPDGSIPFHPIDL